MLIEIDNKQEERNMRLVIYEETWFQEASDSVAIDWQQREADEISVKPNQKKGCWTYPCCKCVLLIIEWLESSISFDSACLIWIL